MQTSCLEIYTPEKSYGSTISRLVSSNYFVYDDCPVADVANALVDNDKIKVVGVVNQKGYNKGIIVRDELLNRLGRPYGREIMHRKTVGDILQFTESFYKNKNILTIVDTIDTHLKDDLVFYYLLQDNSGKFAGCFSSQDIIMYLSNISKQDIHLATNLQERIVNHNLSHIQKSFELQGYSRSAKGLGGDFYYTEDLGDGKRIFAVCDVSGKGIAASLVTTMLWGMMRMYDWRLGLKNFLKRLNENIVKTFQLEKYLTGVFGIYDSESKLIHICDMGHSHNYLIRDGIIKNVRMGDESMPIGIDAKITPEIFKLRLEPDDILLMFTDGLIEQRNVSNEEYGIERLGTLILDHQDFLPADIRDLIRDDFQNFRKGTSQADDVTYILLKQH